MSGFSFLERGPLRLAALAPRHHQTIAASRSAAYDERTCADEAYRVAQRDPTATSARLARLAAAATDAATMHQAWVKADRQAAMAGALD